MIDFMAWLVAAFSWLNFGVLIALSFIWFKGATHLNPYTGRSMYNLAKWSLVVWIILVGALTTLWLFFGNLADLLYQAMKLIDSFIK